MNSKQRTVVNGFRKSVSYHPTCIVDRRCRVEHYRFHHTALNHVDLQGHRSHLVLHTTFVRQTASEVSYPWEVTATTALGAVHGATSVTKWKNRATLHSLYQWMVFFTPAAKKRLKSLMLYS